MIHFRIIFAAFGDRSIFNNPHVGIVYSSTYLYQPQRDHFLQYGTKSGEGLGKPRFQHKSVAYDQSVGGHPVCSPAGALYLADVAPYLGVQRVGWYLYFGNSAFGAEQMASIPSYSTGSPITPASPNILDKKDVFTFAPFS